MYAVCVRHACHAYTIFYVQKKPKSTCITETCVPPTQRPAHFTLGSANLRCAFLCHFTRFVRKIELLLCIAILDTTLYTFHLVYLEFFGLEYSNGCCTITRRSWFFSTYIDSNVIVLKVVRDRFALRWRLSCLSFSPFISFLVKQSVHGHRFNL